MRTAAPASSPTRREVLLFSGVLMLVGAGWGATHPLTKMAVSTGYGYFGLVFWQLVLGAVLMAVACALRRTPLPFSTPAMRAYVVVALLGTVFPNSIGYQAAVYLPSGIMSLLLSAVPMFAFSLALFIGNEQFALRRLVGLCFGLFGVLLIIIPSVDLGEAIPIIPAVAYLVVGFFYAFEGNYVARWGVAGLDPFQLMLGASLAGLAIITPLMWVNGQVIAPQWPLPKPQAAMLATSVIHVFVYASYVWLVGRAGAVFAVQVSYMVTGFGLFWAWLVLGEIFSNAIWLALAAMFAGMYLVQPRPKAVLAEATAMGNT